MWFRRQRAAFLALGAACSLGLLPSAELRAETPRPACLETPGEFSSVAIWTPARWRRLVGELRFANAQLGEADSHRFGYYRFGNPQAPPLVLLIGHGAVMLSWDPAILAALANCFDVYLFDNLGLGQSRFRNEPDKRLAAMTFEDMADFAAHAVAGIDSLRDRQPHGLGWAMGGKVLFLAAQRHPERFATLVNAGGWISKPHGSGPNPCVVERLEVPNPWVIASTTFRVSPSQWGWARAIEAFRAQLGMMTRSSAAYLAAWNTPEAWPTPLQRQQQARASAAPYANDLRRIHNPSLVAYGQEDDRNFPFPESPGAACSQGADKPSRCHGEPECWWGLGPLDDYENAAQRLENASRVCLMGFEGAHGFPSQSRTAFVAAAVTFTTQPESLACENDVQTARSPGS